MGNLNNGRDGNYRNIGLFTLLYAMSVALFSTILFLYGFFPLKIHDQGIATVKDIPTHVHGVRVNNELLYKPTIKKLVIMVIDGLRWDFVAGSIGQTAMPVTSKLIESKAACLLRTKVGSPTVTMPRIKAITTGSAPTFVDVVFNFGSNKISGDSLLLQAKNHGHKLIFYGDDTWLRLFPDIFHRSDGTTSFFVTDYTEVDDNVTRHIDRELKETDWSVMVLHYLGLDHIGHTAGSQSPLINRKLKEMDDIIDKIRVQVEKWQSRNEETLFVVCGDHGMKDSGGHGGNTPQESLVPFVAVGASCARYFNEDLEMDQIDISSTLAILLGIPIPSSNLGRAPVHLLNGLTTSGKLFSLYYNAEQVLHHFKKLAGFKATRAYLDYLNAVNLHSVWLEASGSIVETVDKIVHFYNQALKGMRDELTSSTSKYDLHAMTVAMIFMFHAIYIVTNTNQEAEATSRKIVYLIATNVILFWTIVTYMWDDASESQLTSNDVFNNSLIVMIAIILFSNCCFLAKCKLSINYLKEQTNKGGTMQRLMLSALIIHALSFFSSSFVEEEHRTWYFFWTTFCIVLLYRIVNSIAASSSLRYWENPSRAKLSVHLFFCLLAHATLRHLNSTGDMYAHLPDIADWLQHQDSKISMTLLLLLALASLVCAGIACEESRYRNYSLTLYVSMAICVYLRHMATEAVARLPFYPISRGVYEVHIFWCLLIVFWMFGLLRLLSKIIKDRREFLSLLLRYVVKSWIIVSAMLHRPYNVGLIPFQLLFSIVMNVALRSDHNQDTVVRIFAHYWLGNVFYFYQGNSNNLSTIDVAAGYVGMESYNPYITGLFLAINVYSAPILSYLTLIHAVVSENKKLKYRDDVVRINRWYAICRLVPLAVYALVVSVQRYHLFVWTVFSPKILYEAMYCAVMYFVMFMITLTSFVHDKINLY